MDRITGRTWRRMVVCTIWLISFSALVIAQSETLRINEFMAVNQTILTDEDGEYSDWIEVYNPTAEAVNLFGWSLTDDMIWPQKWIFPNITLNPDEYLVVFASGKNRGTAGSELHTNFKISGDGEYLAFFNPGGIAVTEFDPAFPAQQADISYGFYEDIYVGFSDPTPGADNSQSTATLLPPPVFSQKHGFYESTFDLELSCDVQNAEIYYTTDASTPGALNGTLYTAPVAISTTSVIRAVCVMDGEATSEVVTQTYLFPDDVIRQPNNPEGYPDMWGPYARIEGNAIADYEMDPELMADADFAVSCKEGLLDIPTVSLVSDIGNFFSHDLDSVTGGIYIYTGAPVAGTFGRGWERPASFEFFDPNSSASVQVNCGMKLHGGHSRLPEKSAKHSFLIGFKSEYGPSKLDHAFFGEEEGEGDNNKLVIRAGFCNSWNHHGHSQRVISQQMRDIWTKDTQRDMGHPASKSIYAHLYLNGIYWGLYKPMERMDKDYGAKHLGGDPEDWDVIKDRDEIADGNDIAWRKLLEMADEGVENNEDYQRIQGNNPDGTPNPEIESMVDVVNLADYMMLNFFGANSDWDHHNWAAMRNRVNPGKGFKFLCWDAEHMVKGINDNNLGENNAYCPSRIFQQLLENKEFKRLFADRVQKHCYNGGALTPEANIARWMERRNQIEKAIYPASARWGDYRRDVHQYQTSGPFDLYTVEDHWLPQQTYMLNSYFPQRTNVFLSHLRDAGMFPEIDAPAFLINGSSFTQNTISAGDVLSMTSNQGAVYFTTDGNDPVVWQSSQGSSETILISESTDKKVLVPKSDIGSTWRSEISFNDAAWQVCSGSPGGIGYENNSGYESYITLDVSDDMYTGGTNPNTSCYVRIPFTVDANDLSSFTSLILGIRYDDGFVAYLNGVKVAEANAPASPAWNSTSTDGHEAGSPETFNISNNIGNLNAGDNILSIQGLNTSLTSSDFIISAELIASDQAPSGSISGSAIAYTGEMSLDESSHIKARTFYNGEWSALNNRFFLIPDDLYDIKVTEIHYHPQEQGAIDESEYEFVEIKNTGTSTLDLGGVKFIDGINYEFAPETALKAGEFIVLAASSDYFYDTYGFLPFDEYNGQLDNNGERIVIASSADDTLCSLRYNDGAGWPATADGLGNSLVPVDINPAGSQSNSYDWRASLESGGSPGRDDIITEAITALVPVHQNSVLNQNYPNPFAEITYIDYQIFEDARVRLSVYNMVGQHVTTLVDRRQAAGSYQVNWNAADVSGNRITNGIYFYRIEITTPANTEVITRKMMLMR